MKQGLWKEVYSLVEQSMPDGLTSGELIEALQVGKQQLYDAIFLINSKHSELNLVKSVDFKYRICKRNAPLPELTRKNRGTLPVRNVSTGTTFDLIPKHLQPVISELSISDLKDFNDLLKKALFYLKSSLALLEACKYSNEISGGKY